MPERKRSTVDVEEEVLLASRRRCCICWGLNRDADVKEGQLAHVNRDPSDSSSDNLAYMCFPHHNWYDSKPSQSKAPTVGEARHFRAELYDELKRRDEVQDGPPALEHSRLAAVRVSVTFEGIYVDDERLGLHWIVRCRTLL